MHDRTDPSLPAIAGDWGLTVFGPDELRSTSTPLLDWLNATGAAKVAIHFDVDTIDADEIQLGLGADIGGLSSAEARRVVADIVVSTDVVGLTIAEYIPRQVIHLQQLLAGFPCSGSQSERTASPSSARRPFSLDGPLMGMYRVACGSLVLRTASG